MFKLFRAGECRRPDKALPSQQHRVNRRVESLGQTKVDYFYYQLLIVAICEGFAIRRDEHQIRWLQIAMDQTAFFRRD